MKKYRVIKYYVGELYSKRRFLIEVKKWYGWSVVGRFEDLHGVDRCIDYLKNKVLHTDGNVRAVLKLIKGVGYDGIIEKIQKRCPIRRIWVDVDIDFTDYEEAIKIVKNRNVRKVIVKEFKA